MKLKINSPFMIKEKRYENSHESIQNNKIITFSDDVINIPEFSSDKNDLSLIIQEKINGSVNFEYTDERLENLNLIKGKILRCIVEDPDFLNGYQRAEIYLGSRDMIYLALWASRHMIFNYSFRIEPNNNQRKQLEKIFEMGC